MSGPSENQPHRYFALNSAVVYSKWRASQDVLDVFGIKSDPKVHFFCDCGSEGMVFNLAGGMAAEITQAEAKGLHRVTVRRCDWREGTCKIVVARDSMKTAHPRGCGCCDRRGALPDSKVLLSPSIFEPPQEADFHVGNGKGTPDQDPPYGTFDWLANSVFSDASVTCFSEGISERADSNSLVGFHQAAVASLLGRTMSSGCTIEEEARAKNIVPILGVIDDFAIWSGQLFGGSSETVVIPIESYRGGSFEPRPFTIPVTLLRSALRSWQTGEHFVHGPFAVIAMLDANTHQLNRISIYPCAIWKGRLVLCESGMERKVILTKLKEWWAILKLGRGRRLSDLPLELRVITGTTALSGRVMPDFLCVMRGEKPVWLEIFGRDDQSYVSNIGGRIAIGRVWESEGWGRFQALMPVEIDALPLPTTELTLPSCGIDESFLEGYRELLGRPLASLFASGSRR